MWRVRVLFSKGSEDHFMLLCRDKSKDGSHTVEYNESGYSYAVVG